MYGVAHKINCAECHRTLLLTLDGSEHHFVTGHALDTGIDTKEAIAK